MVVMPPDIRSFFGAKGSQSTGASQEKLSSTTDTKALRPKGRGKRKVVSDSDDDLVEPATKRSSPRQGLPKKAVKNDSPKGEVTTTSDYFASNGRSKLVRSTPNRSTAIVEKTTSDDRKPPSEATKKTPTTSSASIITPKSISEIKNTSASESRRRIRPSPRQEAETKHATDSEEDDVPVRSLRVDTDSGDDIHGAEFKPAVKRFEGESVNSEGEEEAIRRPQHRRANGAPVSAKDNDITLKQERPHPSKKIGANKSPNGVKAVPSGKKSRLAEISEEKQDDLDPGPNRAIGPRAIPVKKTRTPTRKKDEAPETKAMQDIFDSIPTIRPPTPPLVDPNKKFDFRANARKSQATSGAESIAIPLGAENCLAGLTFVFTGILASLEREQGIELVKRYGGKVTTSPSKKTDYVVLGNEAGPKKLETIAKNGIKTINEEGLFALISKLPANGGDSKAAEKFQEKQLAEDRRIEEAAERMEEEEKENIRIQQSNNVTGKSSGGIDGAKSRNVKIDPSIDGRLWTVKYAPTQTNQICGNKIQVEKLQTWLRNWRGNARTKFKKPGKDGSGVYRAVMIHGGPGIGKTTAAHLVAKLEGYDIVESNASDTRSKKLVETGLKGVLDTTSLLGYFAGDGKKVETEKKKLVLIMDEVDGMSAGDRGGVGALAAVCKKTNIPMILICNDRKLPKLKPFDHVTYDLPFRKPTTDQVKSRIMTILFREGMRDQMPNNVVSALIEGSRADIRQVINMISTAKVDQQALDFDGGKKMSEAWEKHVILRPWDIVGKVLGGGLFAASSTSTLNDKIELYFNDHEVSSLMLQENYLGTSPMLATQYSGRQRTLKLLELVDEAAESISDGDLVDRMIHGSQQQWSLMPTHAVCSFVRPASFVWGSLAGNQTRFTSWLGNNSKMGKNVRLVKEIQGHMRLRASGDRHEIRQQYLPVLWQRLVKSLELYGDSKESVRGIIELMDSYFLTKDDWDAVYELGVGPQAENMVKIPSQAKSSFTRTYNQMGHPLPYMKAAGTGMAPARKGREKPDLEEAIEESDDAEVLDDVADLDSNEESELDLKKDKYVKAPKKKAAPKAAAAKRGKGKIKDEEGDEGMSDGSEEDVKPKAKAKAKVAASRGRGKR